MLNVKYAKLCCDELTGTPLAKIKHWQPSLTLWSQK